MEISYDTNFNHTKRSNWWCTDANNNQKPLSIGSKIILKLNNLVAKICAPLWSAKNWMCIEFNAFVNSIFGAILNLWTRLKCGDSCLHIQTPLTHTESASLNCIIATKRVHTIHNYKMWNVNSIDLFKYKFFFVILWTNI